MLVLLDSNCQKQKNLVVHHASAVCHVGDDKELVVVNSRSSKRRCEEELVVVDHGEHQYRSSGVLRAPLVRVHLVRYNLGELLEVVAG